MTAEERRDVIFTRQIDDLKQIMLDRFQTFELILREKDKNLELRLAYLEEGVCRNYDWGNSLFENGVKELSRHNQTNEDVFNSLSATQKDHETRIKTLETTPGIELMESKKGIGKKAKETALSMAITGAGITLWELIKSVWGK